MSLKVYNGIKFKSKNINEILSQLNSIKEQAVKNVIDYYINNQTQIEKFILSKNFDESYVNKVADCIAEQRVNNDTMNIFVKTFKSSMAKEYVNWSDIYANFIVYIIPYKGKYYGHYVCGDVKENEKLLFQFVDEFHYQNQTDKPDDITTREWNKRAEVWDDVFYVWGNVVFDNERSNAISRVAPTAKFNYYRNTTCNYRTSFSILI